VGSSRGSHGVLEVEARGVRSRSGGWHAQVSPQMQHSTMGHSTEGGEGLGGEGLGLGSRVYAEGLGSGYGV